MISRPPCRPLLLLMLERTEHFGRFRNYDHTNSEVIMVVEVTDVHSFLTYLLDFQEHFGISFALFWKVDSH